MDRQTDGWTWRRSPINYSGNVDSLAPIPRYRSRDEHVENNLLSQMGGPPALRGRWRVLGPTFAPPYLCTDEQKADTHQSPRPLYPLSLSRNTSEVTCTRRFTHRFPFRAFGNDADTHSASTFLITPVTLQTPEQFLYRQVRSGAGPPSELL